MLIWTNQPLNSKDIKCRVKGNSTGLPFSNVIFYVEKADGTLLLVFNIYLQIDNLMIKINISVPALKTRTKNMIISFWIIIISRWSSQTTFFYLGSLIQKAFLPLCRWVNRWKINVLFNIFYRYIYHCFKVIFLYHLLYMKTKKWKLISSCLLAVYGVFLGKSSPFYIH